MTRPEDLMDDPDAPISDEEKEAAEELRLALEDPARENDDAALLRAAALAHTPRALDADEHRRILDQALAGRPASTVVSIDAARRRRARTTRVVTVVTGVVALAAAVALWVRTAAEDGAPPSAGPSATAAAVPLIQVRSTQPLFTEPFAAKGGTSARIDRIAVARESDLRTNQFARWGVK